MASICTMAWVYGSVQGVGFRYSTQREALQLGLTGYARNLDDGGVEVLACGEAEQVEKLIAWLKAGGPRSARVDRVLTEPHQPTRSWEKFAIRCTSPASAARRFWSPVWRGLSGTGDRDSGCCLSLRQTCWPSPSPACGSPERC